MNTKRETFVVLLIALLGMALGWWAMQLVEPKSVGDLLGWSGGLVALATAVQKRVRGAYDAEKELAAFDTRTRENYIAAVRRQNRRLTTRMIIGTALGAIAAAIGVIVSNTPDEAPHKYLWAATVGAGALLSSALIFGTQFWALSQLDDYFAATRRIVAQEAKTKQRLAVLPRSSA